MIKRKDGESFDCVGCYYRKPISPSSTFGCRVKCCHYPIEENELRGCSAKECYEKKIHFKPKDEKKNGGLR